MVQGPEHREWIKEIKLVFEKSSDPFGRVVVSFRFLLLFYSLFVSHFIPTTFSSGHPFAPISTFLLYCGAFPAFSGSLIRACSSCIDPFLCSPP